MLFKFIWAGKSPRLKRNILFCARRRGCLAVPDIYRYYLVIHLTRIVEWYTQSQHKQWVDREIFCEDPSKTTPMGRCACSTYTSSTSNNISHNGIMEKSLEMTQISPHPSTMYPVLGNAQFPPGLEDSMFKKLVQSNI